MSENQPRYLVQIAETNNFEIPITAESPEEARRKAWELWRYANTVGQWEIPDTETEIVAVTHQPDDPDNEGKTNDEIAQQIMDEVNARPAVALVDDRAALAAMPDPRPAHGNNALLIARASAMYADIGTLLANLDYLMEATGESLDPEDMAAIQEIRTTHAEAYGEASHG